MKNFFIKKWSDLFIYLLKTVREWFENGSGMVRQMCVAWAMLRGKLVNCAKSVMQIFATYATYASAIFVGEESNESTVRYALWSRISLTKPLQNPYLTLTRFRLSLGSNLSRVSLASLICLCMLTVGVGNAWATTVSGSYTFGNSSITGWTCSPQTTYCGLYYSGKNSNFAVYNNNITNISGVDFSAVSSASITIRVKGITNSGTNSFTVSLVNSSGTALVTSSAQSNQFANSSNKDDAKWSGNIVLTPVAGVTGYKITCNAKSALAGTDYSLTYTAAACSAPTVGSALTSVSTTTNSITATVPISATGGCNITENGLVYSTSVATPTVGAANCTKVTTTACGGTAANKEVTITGLTCGTTYYVRGYATNSSGTSYTNVKTQATSDCPIYTVTLKDDNDTRTQASYGAAVTLPSRAGCSGYTFAGWSTTYNASWTTTAPTIINAGSYTPTDDIDLYPVYTKTESGGGAAVGTTVFSENFGSFSSGNKMTGSQSSSTGNRVIYGGGSVTYSYSNGSGADTKIYEQNSAGGTSPELLVGKYSSTFTITGIPKAGASELTLTYKQNAYSLSAAVSGAGYSGSGSASTAGTKTVTITCGSGSTFNLTFTGPSGNSNVRLDDILITVKTVGSTTSYISVPNCCTPLGSINGSFTSSNLSQSSGVLTATLPNASKNANATSYRFTLYNNSDVEITHTDVASGGGDVSTTFSSPNVTAGNTYKVSVTPLVSPQGSFCSTTGTESAKASITMHYTVTLAVNNAEYGSISPTSTLYVASGTSISASTNTLSVGATNITATYTPQTAQYTYGFTNWTWSPSGSTITANTTATANFSRSTRTYNVTTTGITHATASPAIPATVAYGGSITTTITAESGYHLPTSITVSGASSTWDSSTGELTISSVTGDVTITITGEENSCDGYSFHTGGSDVWNTRAENKCFVQDGVTKRWYISNYTITSNTHFCLNWQGGQYDRGGDNNVRFMTQPWTEMSLAYGRSGKVGVATGAVGTIQMYANSSDDNLYVGFIPDGYVLKYNGVNEVMTQSSTYVWYAPTPYTINSTTQGYTAAVGLNDGSDNYVACDNTTAVKHIFVKVDHSDWTAAAAKYELYNIQTSSFVGEYMRAVPGETNLYEGWIPSGCTSIIIARCNPGADIPTGNTWTNVWNQSQDISLDGSKNYYTINSKDGSNKYYGAWSVYERSGKWYLDLDGTTTGGQKNFSCYFYPHYVLHYDANSGSGAPADQAVALDASPCQLTVSSTVPTRAGYTFLGWNPTKASADAGTKDDAWDGGDTHAMTADVTLYAVWAANHTLSYSLDGGDGSCSGGTYYTGQSFTACNNPGDKTGHSFTAWLGSNSTSYTAGTTYSMPDADLTLTAQWSANSYDVTLTTNGGTINAGNVTSYTYGVGATLPTNVTRDGYRFDGWFSDDGVWSDQVTAISTTATGDKTYYAKWTQVYTVTWNVNGDTWESGVVEGNTHVPGGSKVSALPTAPTKSDCDDSKVFVGWRATAIAGTSASDPGGIFTNVAGSPEISADKTFYAVFADEGKATRTTLYSEPFTGTCGTNTAWASASSYFYNASTASITTTTNWQVSKYTTNPSDNDGASGGSHMLCGSSDKDIVFDFGDKSSYVDLQLSFNFKNEAGKNTNRTIGCYVSGDDGESWTSNLISVSTIQDQDWHACSYNISNGSTGALQVKFSTLAANASRVDDITLTGCAKTYSNYVTSCSSCDADATFSNTTPAVSAIGCDAATLTATGGLATLGADGCHVSDYGFVIGTSDNPVIDGSGVTKLQVGTSDPTIGEDFSYDATGLTKGTHYYIRAYAINRHGTAYSSSTNFWTNDVSSIAITTAPTKTNYIVGETFDATGMVVTATMASGATEDVTSDVTYSSSALTAGTSQNFAINYTLCETEKSVNQVINVYTLTVTEGTNPSYGTASNSSANIVSITGLGDHKTYTVTVTSENADKIDNGDGTYTITNATGNVTVRVDYADAEQVKVYYKVDGVTVTGLTQDVYQSETTTLPTASELATEMTAQGMEIPDDSYPNFVGWSETEFSAQTSEPTLVTGTPTINAEKTYYAVYTNLGKKTILPANLPNSYGSDGDKDIDGVTYYRSGVAKPSSDIQFRSSGNGGTGYIYSKTSLSYILKIEVSGDNLVVNACSDASGTLDGGAITPVGTAPRVYTFPANKQYFQIKGTGSTTNHASRIDIYYSPATVEYMTQFCTRYDITGVTKSGTAVPGGTLTSNYNSACEGKSVELEAVVSTGYQFNGWTIKKTADLTQDVTSTLLGANASSLTPPAFSMPAYAITVSASITEKELTGWTWKQALLDESIAIPSKVMLYVGQQARFELISYDPSDVLAEKKGYNADYTHADLALVAQAGAYYVTRAKAAVESTTLTLTSTSNGSVQEVINIQIKSLPSVTFEDHVHGVVFSAVAGTIDELDKRVVYLTKTTPTTSDFSGTTYNTCEEQHEHLVGWIESSWADEHPEATHSQIAGAGPGVFYTAGASIDVEAQNGKTFYAVWSKIE